MALPIEGYGVIGDTRTAALCKQLGGSDGPDPVGPSVRVLLGVSYDRAVALVRRGLRRG